MKILTLLIVIHDLKVYKNTLRCHMRKQFFFLSSVGSRPKKKKDWIGKYLKCNQCSLNTVEKINDRSEQRNSKAFSTFFGWIKRQDSRDLSHFQYFRQCAQHVWWLLWWRCVLKRPLEKPEPVNCSEESENVLNGNCQSHFLLPCNQLDL